MAEVVVKIFAVVPSGREEVQVIASTVGELLERLVERYGEAFSERVIDEETEEPKRFISIYINGTNFRSLEGVATPLKEGDQVTLIPAVGGG